MKLDDLSLASLKESNPKVYEKILEEVKESLDSKSQEDRILNLESELKEAKDELSVISKEKQAKALCLKKGLTESTINKLFMSQLVACPAEADMIALIEDRLTLAGGSNPTSSRREVVSPDQKVNKNVKESKSVSEGSLDDFVGQLTI